MNEQKIDKYLMNLLSAEERALFEEEMKQNESLMKAVNVQRDALKSIEGLGRMELKSKLQAIHAELHPKKEAKQPSIRSLIYRVASAAAVIGIISFAWFWMQSSLPPEELYSQYFSPYEISLSERSEANETFIQIEQLYENGNYTELIPLLDTEIKKGNQSSQLLLALGIAHLQQNEPTSAIKQFENILDNNDFNFEDEANWYLGLSYLKLNDSENVKRYLDGLANDPKRDHHEEAKAILDQLK